MQVEFENDLNLLEQGIGKTMSKKMSSQLIRSLRNLYFRSILVQNCVLQTERNAYVN